MNIVYFSVTSNEIPNLSEAARLFAETLEPLVIHARTRTQLENNSESQAAFVARAVAADVLMVTLMAGSQSCPAWEALITALAEKRSRNEALPCVHIQPTGSNPETARLVEQYSNSLKGGDWQTLSRYYRYGGVENLKNLLVFCHHRFCGGDTEPVQPVEPPYQGLYHPDHGFIEDVDAHRRGLDPEKPTAGIWFYQNFYTSNNKAHADAMVREGERQGANVAEILYLLGTKPVWQKGSGNVKGLEVIPLSELGRPRIDITPRVSGNFRDAFPLLMDLIDRAVQMAATLEEKIESNFIRGHVFRDMQDLKAEGFGEADAFRQATFRIFGSPPCRYGAGVAQLVEAKAW